MSEHDEQVALFDWALKTAGQHRELDLLFAIPNGGGRPKMKNPKTGKWFSPTANKLKDEGLKSGVPDVCLPVARQQYHGLYIEMKYGYNKLDDNQIWWRNELQKQGYLCWVSYSFEDAKDVILAYLNRKLIVAKV